MVRINYMMRVIAYTAMPPIIVFSNLFEPQSWGFYATLSAVLLAWPHVAYRFASRRDDQKRGEALNLFVDAVLVSVSVGLSGLQLWVVFAGLLFVLPTSLNVGGARLGAATMTVHVACAAIVFALWGPGLILESSLGTTIACIALLLPFVSLLGLTNRTTAQKALARGTLLSEQKHELEATAAKLQEAMEEAETARNEAERAYQKTDEHARQLERSLAELRRAQAQLVQSEKMASLGALTAGIAHEIKNPLNFVNNFAKASAELVGELREELAVSGDGAADGTGPVSDLLGDLAMMTTKIAEHGDRADRIVKSMLQHSRGGGSAFDEVPVNAFVDDYVDLAFHGMRAHDSGFNAEIVRDFSDRAGAIQAVPQEFGRVLVNLLSNAFYAVREQSGRLGDSYTPRVTVRTRPLDGGVEIRVEDNGPGMPASVEARVFEPFFTTKPPGEGTGLGLSLSYDVVTQMHGGRLVVKTTEGAGTTFAVTLPARPPGRALLPDDGPRAAPALQVP